MSLDGKRASGLGGGCTTYVSGNSGIVALHTHSAGGSVARWRGGSGSGSGSCSRVAAQEDQDSEHRVVCTRTCTASFGSVLAG